MEQRVVTIIGGTGFIGRYVVKVLASAGYTLRIISRHPNAALHLKTAGNVGQIVLMEGDLTNPASLIGKIEDSYAIVNLAGILFEGGSQKFAKLHTHGTEKLAQMAKAAGVTRFIQISALGIEKSGSSKYARSKLMGEKLLFQAFPGATVLRPSIVFGPEDNFFNMFARMARVMPALPLIGGGETRFQPVYVGDIAKAVEVCLKRPDTVGQIYELGGPEVLTFKSIISYIQKVLGSQKMQVRIPFAVAPLIAIAEELKHTLSFGWMKPMITRDQIKLMKSDNVVGTGYMQFANLGISPTALEVVVPEYLSRYNKKLYVNAK